MARRGLAARAAARSLSMIPKSGYRFSEKDHAQTKSLPASRS
jgi:hypothetical protein